MRYMIPILPLLLAFSAFTIAETTDDAVSTTCATDNAGCLQSTPTSTSTPAPTASTSSDAHENDTDDVSDSDSDSDSGIIEGYPTTAYSGLEANMQMSEGSTAGYKIGEWGLIWGSLIGMGLGVLL